MSPSNRSLERGLAVLECFRPGVGLLTHREIADRTALPKATVSRLLATLTANGYLVSDPHLRGYRLGVPVLSLSRCLAMESRLRRRMSPLIEQLARATRSIIGFGTAHDTDIVYLEATNGDPARGTRQVGPGMRAPIATTSVGHGYMAGLMPSERKKCMQRLCAGLDDGGARLRRVIGNSLREVRSRGFCMVVYAGGKQAAIGAPVPMGSAPLHALGVGFNVPKGYAAGEVPPQIVEALHELIGRAQQADAEAA
jgi:DNA-binding IclR family transcriptional regulator